jgi:uncharacterized membrane protein YqhA
VRRIIELSRYVAAIPAFGAILGSLVLMGVGVLEVVRAISTLIQTWTSTKEIVVAVLTAIDSLLLATVLMVIGYGIYELFVDEGLNLPSWLEIRSLDDLKNKLIGVIVAVIAVIFLGFLVDSGNPGEVLQVGIGCGAVLIGLAAFSLSTRK